MYGDVDGPAPPLSSFLLFYACRSPLFFARPLSALSLSLAAVYDRVYWPPVKLAAAAFYILSIVVRGSALCPPFYRM